MAEAVANDLLNPALAPDWGKPEFKLPKWAEPVILVTILFGSMFLNRRRGYRIFGRVPSTCRSTLDVPSYEAKATDELLAQQSDDDYDDDHQPYFAQQKHPAKIRSCLGLMTVHTPNSSRFKNYLHSRIFQRFPFLVEMFYWIINWAFYRTTSLLANELYKDTGIWHVAQAHALSILEFEQFSPARFLFPLPELDVQRWFLTGDHHTAMTTMNRAYSLLHIPGTVGFIAWYYCVAPSHSTFATVRRTLTLTNFMAFITFILYPTMPPRFLPKEYGFQDTVRREDAQSVWMSGRYVNALAAMPSMHIGYSFTIGCTLIYYSGAFRARLEVHEVRKHWFWRAFYLIAGVCYPACILATIIATANHYWLDAVVAVLFVGVAWRCNAVFCVFLPLEDWFLWFIRAEKPVPSTGERVQTKIGRI